MLVPVHSAAPRLLGVLTSRWTLSRRERVDTQKAQKVLDELPVGMRNALEAGAALLDARDLQDFERRLDTVVFSFRHLNWTEGVLESPSPSQRDEPDFGGIRQHRMQLESELVRPSVFEQNEEVTRTLGRSQTRVFLEQIVLLMKSLEAFERADKVQGALFIHALVTPPWALHKGESPPLEVVESSIIRWKGIVALLALVPPMVLDRRVEPWLAWALVEKVKDAVRDLATMLASIGCPPDPQFDGVPRVDWVALWRQAHLDAAELDRQLEADIVAGRVGFAEDDDD